MPINLTTLMKQTNSLKETVCQSWTGKLNSLTSIKYIAFVVKNLLISNTPGLDGFTGEFYQKFKEVESIL